MRHASARVLAVLLTFLRSLWWSMVDGLTMLGATFYGGAAVGGSWLHTGAVPTGPPETAGPSAPAGRSDPTRPSDPAGSSHESAATADDVDVTGEAERGIAQIEEFLAARSTDHPGR
ncbi:hypothetical protein CLV30_12753 [Haloactinopolyspora alba]|uniref:Uncharacterized protein n=1 Tax=Haloactinopolyspora alba TaxID=648780 RepID=A0A2P8DFX6_9ACTN|nr:hypothetical protein [Haloactinopolyspora alba]PSK96112.1 hypothetical protein CLV30_12753 [Haloactinopolyspora alba]